MSRVGILAVILLASGCAQTTRIADQEFSVRRLKSEDRAVVLMRVGAASQKCLHVGVLLGVRAGGAYRRVKVLGVANVRSIAAAPVAEAELDAGEYHVVGYSCTGEKGSKVVSNDTGPGSQFFTTSYAHFRLSPGEVVNVGYLHFQAEGHGDSVFGRNIKSKASVTDWPLEEIARFERARPQLFAAMTTRLMHEGEPPLEPGELASRCSAWHALEASGKAAGVPGECRPAAGSPR